MRRLTKLILPLLLISVLAAAISFAQTPDASPVSDGTAWNVTDVQEIKVDGNPIALSPDGQWLAGTRGADNDEVCAWDVETLTPTCADVSTVVEPFIGNTLMQWSPVSSAFAFASGSLRQLEYGDVFVFDADGSELTNLTNTMAPDNGRIALYLGPTWTSDSQQVVFGISYGFGDEFPRPEIGRVDRSGGDVEKIPLLADEPEHFNILTPPLIAGDGSIFVAISSEDDIGGIWKFEPDGCNPQQLASSNEEPPIEQPMIVSKSADDRYLNIVSITRVSLNRSENTFFLLNVESGDLMPLNHEDGLQWISFGPESNTGLITREADGKNLLHTIDVTTGDVTPVANSTEVNIWLQHIPDWAENNTVFLPREEGGRLVTLEPSS